MAGEKLQDGQLGGGEADLAVSLEDVAPAAVDRQVGEAEDLRGDGTMPAELCADPGEQLSQGERLGHEVVRAEVESPHLVLLLAADRQDEHGRGVDPAHGRDQREAVGPRHGEVGHDEVGPVLLELRLAVHAVDGGERVVAGQGQLPAQALADGGVVVHDQDERLDAGHSIASVSRNAGRSRRAIVPPPGLSTRASVPPFASVRLRAMMSPSPPDAP